MNQPVIDDEESLEPKAPFPLWSVIILVIVLMVGIVSLFGLLLFLLVNGSQQLQLPPLVYLAIFVIVSGVFAWLVKRLADALLSASRFWFTEESDE